MEHIFNQFPISNLIWDQAMIIMRQTKRERTSIISTIRNWGLGDFKSPLLNTILQLMLGLIIWQLSKERNRCIYHYHISTPSSISPKIIGSIWETIQIQPWTQDDIPTNPQESLIVSTWNMITPKSSLLLFDPPLPLTRIPSNWSSPPLRFWKLNFDGASKGPTSFGAVIKDSTGKIKQLGVGFLGHEMKKLA
jgi:hypothetical protein